MILRRVMHLNNHLIRTRALERCNTCNSINISKQIIFPKLMILSVKKWLLSVNQIPNFVNKVSFQRSMIMFPKK